MEIILQIFGLLFFISSTYGLCYVVKKKIKVQMNFVVIYVLSGIAVVTYIGGIFMILQYVVYAIALVGSVGFVYAIVDIRKKLSSTNFEEWCEYNDFQIYKPVFALCTIVLLVFLLGVELEHYDNYSHWAIVVKDMLIHNAFPTAESVLVEFKNYPLGTSSFIYYVCMLVGNSQGVMLMAQGTLIFAGFYAVFGIITEVKRFLLYIFLGTSLSFLAIFNISIRINNLLVDFVLPVLTLSAIATIYRYRDEINKAMILITPTIALLMIVKSTGVIFACVPLLYLLYVTVKFRKENEIHEVHAISSGGLQETDGLAVRVVKVFTTIVAISIPYLLWLLHMKLRFAGVENKFEVSSEVVSNGFGGKTPEEVEYVIQLFLHRMFDIQDLACQGIFGFIGCAFIAYFVARVIFKKKWALGKVALLMLMFAVTYYAGILAMYVFSMPMYEAEFLAGYERYASSIVILVGGVLAICATVDMENSFHYKIGNVSDYKSFKSITTKSIYNKMNVVCMCAIFLLLISEYNGMCYNKAHFHESFAYTAKEQLGDNWSKEVDETRYLILASDSKGEVTNGYTTYVSRYYLYAENVDVICAFYEENLLNLLSQHDKLIVMSEHEEDMKLMERYFGVDGTIGEYDTKELLKKWQSKG